MPSYNARTSSLDVSRSSPKHYSPDRIAGRATFYDAGDVDLIFAKKDRPAYSSTNASYGAVTPQFFTYEKTFVDVQRLRENLLLQTQLARERSESDLRVAEEVYDPGFAKGTTNPHAAPKFNRNIREQAEARRIEDLKRLRVEEYNSQMRGLQRQQEYREYLDMQKRLKEGGFNTEVTGPAYSSQPRHTRKTLKTISYNPVIGEVRDYSAYHTTKEFRPAADSTSEASPQSFNQSYMSSSEAYLGADEGTAKQIKGEGRNKLAGYGQMLMTSPTVSY